MKFISTQKFVRMTPRKLRLVADAIRDLKPIEALEVLPHVGKRAAKPLEKVIKTALANAKVKGISETDLVFKEIQIGEGPRLKRGRPVSRGRWHPILKRMSHIRVVLESVENKKSIKSTKGAKSIKGKVKSNKHTKAKNGKSLPALSKT